MVITISNVIRITSPSNEVRRWCNKHLVLPNPDYIKKSRMGFYVNEEKTPRKLYLFQDIAGDLILPYGVLKDLPKSFMDDAVFCCTQFKEPVKVDYKADGLYESLYGYQKEAVDQMIKANFGILHSAAGSGKTQMGIALACKLGVRTLWLCHTKDLIQQSKERALKYIDKSLIGTITGGKVNVGKGITFATIQTMANLDLTQYKDLWGCVIVDEVHRVSGTPTSITRYQKVLNSLAVKHKYGLSATAHRADGMIEATYSLIGRIAYSVPDEAVADKVMQVGICPIGTGVKPVRYILNSDGILNYARYINYLAENKERTEVIIDTLVKDKGRPSLILSDRIEHLENMINELPENMRKDAVMVDGGMVSKKDQIKRKQALDDMRSGKKKYLFTTYALSKEGLDIPRLERLYLATPQKDYAVITQAVGRVARTFEGKDNPIVYDFVDDISHSVKAYKERCTTYRKNGCYFVEVNNEN